MTGPNIHNLVNNRRIDCFLALIRLTHSRQRRIIDRPPIRRTTILIPRNNNKEKPKNQTKYNDQNPETRETANISKFFTSCFSFLFFFSLAFLLKIFSVILFVLLVLQFVMHLIFDI